LHLASQNGHVEVAQFLVEHGADPSVQDKDGCPPLRSESPGGHIETVQSPAAAQKKVGGLRGIWRRSKDMLKSRSPSLGRKSRASSSRVSQM
jgi:hypothetical protein